MDAVNLLELEELARSVMDPGAFAYVAGGAGDERTMADNRAAFARRRIEPRVLRGLAGVDLTTEVAGGRLAMPVLIAPMAHQGLVNPDGDLGPARAAAAAGAGFCLSCLANHGLEEVAAAGAGGVRWAQLYPFRDPGQTREHIARAAATGYGALVVTVDVPTYGLRERDVRAPAVLDGSGLTLPCVPLPPGRAEAVLAVEAFEHMKLDLAWDDVAAIVAESPLPVLLKGVLAPDDARLAAEIGAAGVVVSNHGGRQLDGVAASLDALPAVADAVGGALEIHLDSGVRRGTDVLVALALGARACLVGRPISYANALGGEEGVARALGLLRAEIENALLLAGCGSVAEVGATLVRPAIV
ncbi:MAG TPA: alpha-hydroxy acid oxidase [Miltoncostaeaceae bacterium]|nr:alpha-hydroxy acid oxidase [Miltoncostaeaceae bacterium]